MDTILAVDIGTTSLKAALVTRTGEVAAYSKQPLAQGNKAALGWMAALNAAMMSLLGHGSSRYNFCSCSVVSNGKNHSATGQCASDSVVEWSRSDCIETSSAKKVAAIAISGNGPTLVAPDGTTLLWNAPVPSTEYHGQKSIFLPRIAAFSAMYPKVWTALDRAHPLCSGPEFMAYQLTGNAVTVLPEARYAEAYWDDERLDALGIPIDILPPFAPPAQQVGIYNGTPVFCTGPDFIAAMIGTDSLEAGRMYDCAGSSEGVNMVVSDKWLADIRSSSDLTAKQLSGVANLSKCETVKMPPVPLRVLPSVISSLWNVAVIIPESGSIFVNYRRIVEAVADREVTYGELIDTSLANHDSDGYEILQYIACNFSDAVGVLLGCLDTILSKQVQAKPSLGNPDIAAESLGGHDMGYSVTQTIPEATSMVVTGGQTRNDKWMQMKSDMSCMPLAVMKCPDAELMGDAVTAWTGLGEYPTLQAAAHAICHIDMVYKPSTGKNSEML